MKKRVDFACLVLLWILTACNPSDGRRAYDQLCNNCHMDQAQGLVDLIPPLEVQAFTERRSGSVCKIFLGTNDSSTGQFMPAFKLLPSADLANILNYIIKLKDYDAKPYTDKEISTYLDECN